MSAMERQRHSKEFKEQAVRMSYASGKSVTGVAADLGIHVKMLYRWRREAGAVKVGQRAFPGHGRARDEELAALHKRVKQAEMERDILKKAVSFFAQSAK
jgi:transposase